MAMESTNTEVFAILPSQPGLHVSNILTQPSATQPQNGAWISMLWLTHSCSGPSLSTSSAPLCVALTLWKTFWHCEANLRMEGAETDHSSSGSRSLTSVHQPSFLIV
jgi:hypothetical protein